MDEPRKRTVDEMIASLPPEAFDYQGKFAAKLSRDQRCEILAFHMKGVNRSALAKAFGLNKRTISSIYNEQSVHYKEIRDIRNKMGADAFMREYITEEGTMKVAAVVSAPIIRGPNRNANAVAGIHLVKDPSDKSHRIIVEWREDQKYGNGWYYQDLDEFPGTWLYSSEESLISSNSCLKGAKMDLGVE